METRVYLVINTIVAIHLCMVSNTDCKSVLRNSKLLTFKNCDLRLIVPFVSFGTPWPNK